MKKIIRIVCKTSSLDEVNDLQLLNVYEQLVRPLNYDFCLVKNQTYLVLGILMQSGTPWLYVVSSDVHDNELQIIPAALFSFDWNQIPNDWSIRIDGKSREDIEMLPKKIATIDYWFEKYVDEEEDVLALVNDEINSMKSVYVSHKQPKEPEDPYAWPFEEYK